MSTQDWNNVVISKKKPASGTTVKDVDAARRAGAQVAAVKKFAAGSNNNTAAGPSKNTSKLDAETEELHHDKVSSELKTNIMKARLEKKMTQAQLAQAINELPKIVQDYEAGKAIPNQAIISKMERALGVPLRPKKK